MSILLTGFKAADLDRKTLSGDVVCHVLDIYHRHAIEKVHHVKAVCSAHLPEGEWEKIRFKTGPKLMSGELALEMLQECSYAVGGDPKRVELVFTGRERERNDLWAKVFGKDARKRDFSAHYTASVPGSKPISLVSLPGCFCHRRTDEGGLALAETVAKEIGPGKKLLDMGCGSGLVGFLVASAVPGTSLVMVDSHSRATEAAEINSKALGIPAEIILADNGTPERMDGTFDVFAGNPPYYSEYRIAEVFCETALRALKRGGVSYLVCKNAAGLEPVVKKYFPSVEIAKRRGYAVLKSVKP